MRLLTLSTGSLYPYGVSGVSYLQDSRVEMCRPQISPEGHVPVGYAVLVPSAVEVVEAWAAQGLELLVWKEGLEVVKFVIHYVGRVVWQIVRLAVGQGVVKETAS